MYHDPDLERRIRDAVAAHRNGARVSGRPLYFVSRRTSPEGHQKELVRLAIEFNKEYGDALKALRNGRSTYAYKNLDGEIELSCTTAGQRDREVFSEDATIISATMTKLWNEIVLSPSDIEAFSSAIDRVSKLREITRVFITMDDGDNFKLVEPARYILDRDALFESERRLISGIKYEAGKVIMRASALLEGQGPR